MTTTSARTVVDREQFFIGGAWTDAEGREVHRVIEAATEEQIGVAALASDADIDAGVRAAREAFDRGPWPRMSPGERADIMERFADALLTRAEQTSELVSRENGMPITTSTVSNGQAPALIIRMYAEMIRGAELEDIRPSLTGRTVVRREPVGVVGAIVPWNFPQTLAALKIGPALAAGCTMVLKHSPEAALDPYVFADAALDAGLPHGVLNVVLGGREAGAALVSHPEVDKIAFTGSTATGRLIGAECGRLIRRVTLELGGKSASVVLDDVDLDTFVQGLGESSFVNNSQTCVTQSRILAPRSRYAEVVDAVAAYADALVVGNPLDPTVTCGPMASESHQSKVLGYIDLGKRSDARLVTGGRPRGGKGWFVTPTIFADVHNDDRLAREEIFGPVIVVIPYEDEDHAVALANDSNYGLGGSVWTQDDARGRDVANRIRTGTIGVNLYSVDLNAPAGGMKDSGIGREMGPEGLDAYLEYKSIYLR